MMREFPVQESIPKTALLQFLQSEYESIEGCETAPHPFPVQQLFPMMHPQGVASSGGGAYSTGPNEGIRSPLRRGQSSTAMESEQDMADHQTVHQHSSGGGHQFHPYQ